MARERLLGQGSPGQLGQNNFDTSDTSITGIDTSLSKRSRRANYDFRLEILLQGLGDVIRRPGASQRRSRKERDPHNRPAGMQGFVFNLRRAAVSRSSRPAGAAQFRLRLRVVEQDAVLRSVHRTRSLLRQFRTRIAGLPAGPSWRYSRPYAGRSQGGVRHEITNPATDGTGNIRPNLRNAIDTAARGGLAGRHEHPHADAHRRPGEVMEFEIMLVSPTFERVALPFTKNLNGSALKRRSAPWIARSTSKGWMITTSTWSFPAGDSH